MKVNKYRNASGMRYTTALFLEIKYDPSTAIYSLKDTDVEKEGIVYPSLYRLYMEEKDPTEFTFATKHFESFDHWNEIASSQTLKEHVARWRRELELKLKSEALARIISIAQDVNNKSSLPANRFLVEKGYDIQPKGKVGRPSKDEVRARVSELAKEDKDLLADFQRIMN